MPVTNGGYHVNGSAFVWVSFNGVTYERLGFTDNGVDINVQQNKGEIITDVFGPMTPQDFQDFGLTARVVCPFIYTDRAILDQVLAVGDASAIGEMNTPGLVVGVNGYTIGVYIEAPFDLPWTFLNCTVRPGFGSRLGVKANVFRLEFQAWPYQPPTVLTGKDAPLYLRSIP